MNPPSPNSEEKLWAVLSHLAVLAGSMGLVIPVYAWAENRRKSPYAAFQSAQALGYQSLGYTLWGLAYLLVLIVFTLLTLPLLPKGSQNPSDWGGWLTLHILLALGAYGLYIFFPLLGAVMCALGRDFRYPFMGGRLARFLAYIPGSTDAHLDEQHEERFVVSMAHFCVIFPLVGLVVPLALWSTQGKRSPYIRFQTLQTIVFQSLGTLAFLVLGLLALVVFIVAIVLFVPALGSGQPPLAGLFGVFVFLICLAVIFLVVPLFQIVGQWAGLRVLQGHDYRYSIIGRWLEKRLAARADATIPPAKDI